MQIINRLIVLVLLHLHLLVSLVEAQQYTSAAGTRIGITWSMPASFGFEQSADFSWSVQDGIDLMEMWVRDSMFAGGVNGKKLPLGPCTLSLYQNQTCTHFINNGTAQFGGQYAQGLKLGERYFISLVWITKDSSSNGTVNSPTFLLQPPAASSSSTSPSLLPTPTTTISSYSSSPTATSLTKPPSKPIGTLSLIGLGLGGGFFFLACVLCTAIRHLRHRRVLAATQAALATSQAIVAAITTSTLTNTPVSAGELEAGLWDVAGEVEGSRGGVELDGTAACEIDGREVERRPFSFEDSPTEREWEHLWVGVGGVVYVRESV